ncbi:hypothetical protein J6590_081316 [Homalodisca vitripennis]|nr:hypothetical protein J6590_081316 [Homalodisca vitripennis]
MSHRKCFRDAAHNAISPPPPGNHHTLKVTHTAKVFELQSPPNFSQNTGSPEPQHGPFRSPTGTTTTKRLSHADRAASSLLARLTRAPVLSDSLGSVRNPQILSCTLCPIKMSNEPELRPKFDRIVWCRTWNFETDARKVRSAILFASYDKQGYCGLF